MNGNAPVERHPHGNACHVADTACQASARTRSSVGEHGW
jgi:hypothetical protein